MNSLIYENRTFLNLSRIEKDGDYLIFTRKNVSGEKREKLKLKDILKISANKKIFSYFLKIDSKDGKSLDFGGLDEKGVEELKSSLGSLVEIHSASMAATISLEEARKGAAKILENLTEDFDGRSIISYLITQAVQLQSSDIHITPRKEYAFIQYRLDGLLQEVCPINTEIFERVLATLKNRSKLPSYKKSVPQDGSFHFQEGNLNLDIRCATIPTLFGEKVVMRILNSNKTPLMLEELGFSTEIMDSYRKLIKSPQGCIVLTGPAGSGKTTTIFASLINIYKSCEGKVNIATLEDPAEYIIEEFQQTQINPVTGLTFETGLKSLLRLDPDIIMVGEIRDPETAHMAMRTALTGHLIFTTLHSRNSIGVFPRLIELEIKPAMASSALTAVLYQRLIRKLCPHCKIKVDSNKNLEREMKFREINCSDFYTSKGCSYCSNTRYSGRTGIFELLLVDERIREMIIKGSTCEEIYKYCKNRGMKFLWENALEKVALGITDFSEITRVCPGMLPGKGSEKDE
ncbi:MAG TPA: GspE/PulE family protein [Candidatus Eremiobacteraeota bacterium]|nr:MAG: Type II secretion system protein E [bacterium ADurb.Bin363]HPZ08519.1 GspE/PulE family protein [Candidatus Eremiobacteraeota bacterium]